MILGRLLSTGKALMALRDMPSSYRMRREALLPKFGTDANPFNPEAKTEQPATVAIQSGGPVQKTTGTRGLLWPWKWPRSGRSAPAEVRPTVASKAGVLKSARNAVQCELSLDNVKVVRNDLCDRDGDSQVRIEGAAVRRPVVSGLTKGAENALDRLAARIVGDPVS